MIDIRGAILDALPKDLLLDLEDRLRAAAVRAHEGVKREFPMNAKRMRAAEGQVRFRLQEEGYEEVVVSQGGQLLSEGVMVGTDLKIFQPFARFLGQEFGVILGFAAMPEPRKLPPKNQSRAAGVTLNVRLQPGLFNEEDGPKSSDIFALFLTARDRERAGMIEEIAIGVIGSNYKDFIFYESLEAFLSGYAPAPVNSDGPNGPDDRDATVKLRKGRKLFIPPEAQPDDDVGNGAVK